MIKESINEFKVDGSRKSEKYTLESAAVFPDIHDLSSSIENLSYYNITNRIDFQCFKRIFLNRFFRTIIRRRTSTAHSPDGSGL